MATASGTSVKGTQRLIAGVPSSAVTFSVAFASTPLPPKVRVGYYYIYTYLNSAPFQSFVVSQGVLYRPGTFRAVGTPSAGVSFLYLLEVDWNFAGLGWVINF